jgi:hypothetical protein
VALSVNVVEADADASVGRRWRGGARATLAKNLLVLTVLAGGYLAVETGYFSNDRTSRAQWDRMERLKREGKGRTVYETRFESDLLDGRRSSAGYWSFYNDADKETASIADGTLELRYTYAWIGAQFRHTAFAPHGIYRVTVEAKVEEQPAAILMRNRQLDLMREKMPVTDGAFKDMSFVYVAPGGRLDQVNVIFMPDAPQDVKGRLTVRKLRIEQLGD